MHAAPLRRLDTGEAHRSEVRLVPNCRLIFAGDPNGSCLFFLEKVHDLSREFGALFPRAGVEGQCDFRPGASAVIENVHREGIRPTRAKAAGVEGCSMIENRLCGAQTDGSAESHGARELQ